VGSDCALCPLHEGATNVCIGGVGRKTAPFLVVVSNPSPEEDLAGKLGSGKHTRILIDLLKEAGFSGEEVRITSAVRCTTPYGGPKGEEEDACREYLRTEIHEIWPKRIIAVGDAPLRVLCKRSGVMSVRGQSLPLHVAYGLPELEVTPIYGIGMLSKTPNYRGVIIEDLRRARNHALTPSSVDYIEGYGGSMPLDLEGTNKENLRRMWPWLR
jgi:uracil-DNA glycosylase family 4